MIKNYSSLLLFSLFGISLWFFGNLYKGIAITPNLLTDPARKIYNWQQFFATTNPVFFTYRSSLWQYQQHFIYTLKHP